MHSPDSDNLASPHSNAPIDRRIVAAIDDELRPHVGAARAAFERQAACEASVEGHVVGGSRSRAWWVGGGLVTALAASVAVAGGLWLGGTDAPPAPADRIATGNSGETSPGVIATGWSPASVTQHEVWRSQDAGIALVDGQPHRAIERERVQTAEFVDDAGYTVRITVPERNYVLVDLDVSK